jgi:hypothetical protein
MDLIYEIFQKSEIKTSPIEDRLYNIDESFKPHSVEYPLIMRWLKTTVPYQRSGIEKLDKKTRQSFCKMCILSLLSQLKRKQLLLPLTEIKVHKPPSWFSPTETICKLNEFSTNMEDWFSLSESESLIREMVSYGQELLAAELVCRGVKVSFELCISLLPFGSILYSLQELNGDKIYKTLPIENESYMVERDTFEFVEVFNGDFCEISTNSTSQTERLEPKLEDPLLVWKDSNTNSISTQEYPKKPKEEHIDDSNTCLSESLELNQTPIQLQLDTKRDQEKYTNSFFLTKLTERLEEAKEQNCQYERWDSRSRWWMNRPDEFLISLQQNELSHYISDLFSPSGMLLDRDYSLIRCSTRLDQAIQQLNEKYDLAEEIEFEAINEDDDKNVEEELNLLLS